jgi:succinate dehydrogenase / fumarate reductase cytochrome b subunit
LDRFLKGLSSSVGKKFLMGITGLLLCVFLVAHLGGNLLLYVSPSAYNHYAHGLHTQEWLIRIAEVGLAVLFAVHIYLSFRTSQENYAARRHRYVMKQTKLDVAPHTSYSPLRPETWMLVSGLIVLVFLILHLSEFTWQIRLTGPPDEEPYDKAVRILRDNLTGAVYLAGTLVLGVHLWHGFASAFQSIGLMHPRYAGLIKWSAVAFGCVIGLGFASFVFFARLVPTSAP